MTSTDQPPREIRGESRTVFQLLDGCKYAIDYYQREYKWQPKQVAELVEDLTTKFLESYEPGDERGAVRNYGHYFLGSIIVSVKGGQKYVIDGQQRLTTLTLLLIALHHQVLDAEQKGTVARLIFSQKYGKRSFNLDVPERTACMEALYTGSPFTEAESSESVANIRARYSEFGALLPAAVTGDALPYFVDWLIENVHLIEITAYSDNDAYTIFETMNDRGLSLTPVDMLKGYLLANIGDADRRNRASGTWKQQMRALTDLGKDEDADGIKAWLRSQHAKTIRKRERGASPEDFDLIGTEFHRWVRDHEDPLGLTTPAEFARIIERDVVFYTRWYVRLRRAAETLTRGLESVHFNAQHRFTLQYPLLLAPIGVEDDEETALRKVRVVAAWVDIVIHRRIWNTRAFDYSTMQYGMFQVMLAIRGKSALDVAQRLSEYLDSEKETFTETDRNAHFGLHGMNGPQIHKMLARMTDFLETRSGLASRFSEYVQRGGRDGYEIEHIWANHSEDHRDEFADSSEFSAHRNRIGGLLLLPKSFNASYGDDPYEKKRDHYLEQNLLARSLHEQVYENNPGFRQFRESTGLPFRAHPTFTKADLEARQALYRKLASLIWSPDRLEREATS